MGNAMRAIDIPLRWSVIRIIHLIRDSDDLSVRSQCELPLRAQTQKSAKSV